MRKRSLAGLGPAETRAAILEELERVNGNRTVAAVAFDIDRRSLVRIIARLSAAEEQAAPVCAACGLVCEHGARACSRCKAPSPARPATLREAIDDRWGSLGGEHSHRKPRRAKRRTPTKTLRCSACGTPGHYATNRNCPNYGKEQATT